MRSPELKHAMRKTRYSCEGSIMLMLIMECSMVRVCLLSHE